MHINLSAVFLLSAKKHADWFTCVTFVETYSYLQKLKIVEQGYTSFNAKMSLKYVQSKNVVWCLLLMVLTIFLLTKSFCKECLKHFNYFHGTHFFTIFLLSWSPPWTLKHLTATYPKAPCIDNRTTELAPDPSSPSLPTMQNISELSSSFSWNIWARLHET